MADTHEHAVDDGPNLKLYLTVAAALAIFTASSFGFNYLAHPEVDILSKEISFLLILSVAICKATLVGCYFMHLKWDWPNVYFIIVPISILATMMMIVLLPDIVLAWL